MSYYFIMSYSSYPSKPKAEPHGLIYKHGGYRDLLSFQTTTIIYDLVVIFVNRYIPRGSRTKDQMEQAARSGRQNIAEGSAASATSKKTEMTLTNVARASLEELLLDCEDFLRQRGLLQWAKDHPRMLTLRKLGYLSSRSSSSYMSYMEAPESAANTLICLIHQANYLLDRQLQTLEKVLLEEGGFTERLYKKRVERRGQP